MRAGLLLPRLLLIVNERANDLNLLLRASVLAMRLVVTRPCKVEGGQSRSLSQGCFAEGEFFLWPSLTSTDCFESLIVWIKILTVLTSALYEVRVRRSTERDSGLARVMRVLLLKRLVRDYIAWLKRVVMIWVKLYNFHAWTARILLRHLAFSLDISPLLWLRALQANDQGGVVVVLGLFNLLLDWLLWDSASPSVLGVGSFSTFQAVETG